MRQNRIQNQDCNQGKRTFHDGEGVKLSRKTTMLHVDTLNNKSFKIQEQHLIELK